METIIGLIAGAVGGNAAGGLLKRLNQGTLINSIAGIVGGGVGGQVLSMVTGGAVDPAATDAAGGIGPFISQIAGGAVGGGGALAIVGVIKNMMAK